jgi:hypothetical protein
MRLVATIVVALVALAFAAVNGVLMCVSPRHHAAFWRWYTRVGGQASWAESGAQVQLRIAGLLIVAVSVFFGWILAGKILGH